MKKKLQKLTGADATSVEPRANPRPKKKPPTKKKKPRGWIS